MNRRVLFVDDEPNILQAIKRAIRKDFDVVTAVGPEAGLQAIHAEASFAMIVSDMRMPGMSGVDFLQAAKQLSPDSVRVMLTGNSDQETAMAAVNDGEVFRFLTKPCDIGVLRQVVHQGLRQYQLQTAEQELMEQTLKGSLAVLTELLSLARPEAFGRTCRLKMRVAQLVEDRDDLTATERWEIETATMLSQLGSLTIPMELQLKVNAGEILTESEQTQYEASATRAAALLENVPRMEQVAKIVAYQHKHYDGGGYPVDAVKAEAIPLGARALHFVLAHDALRSRGYDEEELYEELRSRRQQFDPRMLQMLGARPPTSARLSSRTLTPPELAVGMRIEQDVASDFGSLLVCEGQEVTDAILEHLNRFYEEGNLSKPFKVSVADSQTQTENLLHATG
ncbi:MAG: HD domain-containing phosphohydrolase [Pseudomonadota bacterium]